MKLIHLTLVLLFLMAAPAWSQTVVQGKKVDESGNDVLPWNRMLRPAGKQIYFGDKGLENHALDAALSPDGKWLAVEERYSVVFIDTKTDEIVDTLPIKSRSELAGAMSTYSGIIWHQTGNSSEVLWSAATSGGKSYVIRASWKNGKAGITDYFSYDPLPPAKTALPNELLIRKENGRDYLYVVLDGNNELVKQDLETGNIIWRRDTGVAPYGIAEANGKLFVTNWGGRLPLGDEDVVAGVPWGEAKVTLNTGATREGSISVFDPNSGQLIREIVTGLHPNEIVAAPRGKYIYITNSNSDDVSVIDPVADKVTESIMVRLQPGLNKYWGDSPEGITVSKNGKYLYVANGMDNAVAVVRLGKHASARGIDQKSKVVGFIPTGAYPSSITIADKKKMYVTNIEAMGAHVGLEQGPEKTLAYNSHHMLASVSVIPMPDKKELAEHTNTVIAVNDLARVKLAELPPRKGVEPKPVPDRIGEPSVFKHVLYIIKENRTYDQVLGDVKKGRGDSTLCIYGRKITPNMHRLVNDFVLMDNYMASGKCSAEGHQWTDASIVTDYVEKNVRAWFRSYPHVQYDALVYAPTGFIWDNAMKHGVSVKIYGEAAVPEFDKSLGWKDIYQKFVNGEPFHFTNKTTVGPVKPILSKTYPGYDHHAIPDVMRADAFIEDLKKYENMEGDSLPQLMVMALPADHTAGTRPGYPTPRAMVADNDLALGQIVEALSHSRFWSNTVIFVTEDDSQTGWDHISAYRTVGTVISPYSRKDEAVHAAYNQPAMVRTIEQILGLPPMNIQDAIAPTMDACFDQTPDYTPYKSVKNQIPLDEMNAALSSLRGKALHYANISMEPQYDHIDGGDDDLLNRILWFSAKGKVPYPARLVGEDNDDDD